MLKSDPFCVGNTEDEVVPYVLVSNGHDGKTSLSVTPTTVRVVCSNTLHMVIPADAGVVPHAAITVGHMGNLQSKVTEARIALKHYNYALDTTKRTLETLQKREINKAKMIEFFTECYTRDYIDNLYKSDKDGVLARREDRMKKNFAKFTDRFDQEVELCGASWWTAFNAYSGYVQHDSQLKGADDADRIEKRSAMNLLGKNATRTSDSLMLALAMSS